MLNFSHVAYHDVTSSPVFLAFVKRIGFDSSIQWGPHIGYYQVRLGGATELLPAACVLRRAS